MYEKIYTLNFRLSADETLLTTKIYLVVCLIRQAYIFPMKQYWFGETTKIDAVKIYK